MSSAYNSRQMPEATADLIARARHDRAAFSEIYDLYLRRVYAFCRAHSAGQEEAEDLTALTFERALVAIARYEERGTPFSSWLLRIAANAAADRWRRGGRETSLAGDDAPHDEPASSQPQATEWVEQWERAAWMRGCLAALPEDQERAVRLRFFEDRSIAEVAALMGRSEGAAKQLLHRALKALRVLMSQEGMAHA